MQMDADVKTAIVKDRFHKHIHTTPRLKHERGVLFWRGVRNVSEINVFQEKNSDLRNIGNTDDLKKLFFEKMLCVIEI